MSISITYYSHVHQEWVLLTGKFPGWSVWKQKREWGQSTDSALHRWLGGSYWQPNNSPFHRQTLLPYGWGQSQIQQLDPRRLPEKETRVKFVYLEKTTHSFKKVIIIILSVFSTKDQQKANLDHKVIKAGKSWKYLCYQWAVAVCGSERSFHCWFSNSRTLPPRLTQTEVSSVFDFIYMYILKLVTFWRINITMPYVTQFKELILDSLTTLLRFWQLKAFILSVKLVGVETCIPVSLINNLLLFSG